MHHLHHTHTTSYVSTIICLVQPWITGWSVDCATSSCCSEYNEWRFGLDKLSGYYAHHFGINPWARGQLIADFATRDITYLVGTEDTANCKINAFPGCNDNELATYCPAMLQVGEECTNITQCNAMQCNATHQMYLYTISMHPRNTSY